MKLVQCVRDNDGRAQISGLDVGREEDLYLIQTDDDRLLLPVYPGMRFGLKVSNLMSAMLATPAFVESAGTRRNIYWANNETDPNLCPSTGGMWEVRGYGSQKITGFALPERQSRPFIASSEGLGFDGFEASSLVVYTRTAVDPHAAPPRSGGIGGPLGFLLGETEQSSRGSRGAGPVIGAGRAQASGRIITNLDYNQDAGDPVTVTIVDRKAAQVLLSEAGVAFTSWSW